MTYDTERVNLYLPTGILPLKARWLLAVQIFYTALEVINGTKWLTSELKNLEMIYKLNVRLRADKGDLSGGYY